MSDNDRRDPDHEPDFDPDFDPDLDFESMEPGQFFQLAWTFYLALAIAGIIWLASVNEVFGLRLFIDPDRWFVDVGWGAAGALALVGGWHVLRLFVGEMHELEDVMVRLIGPVDGFECFVLALISGFAEELFFRGAVQGSLGWIWATLIFGFIHTGPGAAFRIWTVFALIAGALFAWLRIHTGALVAPMVAHVLVNWIQFVLLLERPDPDAEDADGGLDLSED